MAIMGSCLHSRSLLDGVYLRADGLQILPEIWVHVILDQRVVRLRVARPIINSVSNNFYCQHTLYELINQCCGAEIIYFRLRLQLQLQPYIGT